MIFGLFKKNTRQIGFSGEDRACEFLEEKGYCILERNYTYSKGEIDIIASDDEFLVFVEVKTRDGKSNFEKYGYPRDAVTRDKQRMIISTARAYLRKNKSDLMPRFDVIEVYNFNENGKEKNEFFHIENAFNLNTAGVVPRR